MSYWLLRGMMALLLTVAALAKVIWPEYRVLVFLGSEPLFVVPMPAYYLVAGLELLLAIGFVTAVWRIAAWSTYALCLASVVTVALRITVGPSAGDCACFGKAVSTGGAGSAVRILFVVATLIATNTLIVRRSDFAAP